MAVSVKLKTHYPSGLTRVWLCVFNETKGHKTHYAFRRLSMATVGSFKSLYSRRKLASVYGLYQLEMPLVCVYGPESWTIQQRIRENWRKILVNTFMDLLSVALTRKQKGLYRRGTYFIGTECGLKNGIQIFKIYIFIGCFFCIAPYMQQPA